jgi:hypothetical protein
MTTTSLASLVDGARRLTQTNSDPAQTARPAPTTAAQDPFVEPILEALADQLPVGIREQLRASGSLDDVEGGLAAGAVFELLADEPDLQRRLLQQLALPGCRPREVALALARAYGDLHFPPTQTAKWKLLDFQGLGLQLATAAAIWIIRGLLFCHLAERAGCLPMDWTWHDMLLFSTGLMLSAGKLAATKWLFAVFAFVTAWMGFEAFWAPRLLETVRRLPAISESEPPPVSWRADTFTWVWQLFVVVMGGTNCIAAAVSFFGN